MSLSTDERVWMWEADGTAHFVAQCRVDVDPRGTGVTDILHECTCGKEIETFDPRADDYRYGSLEEAEADRATICAACLAEHI